MMANENQRLTFQEDAALLVIEFQKTWTERGLFHRLIKSEYESRNVYANAKRLLDTAREKGALVIQAPLILDRKNKTQYRRMPLIPKLARQFTANTWQAEYTDGIFHPSDHEVVGRTSFDACKNSNLLNILNSNSVRKVYCLGFTTEHCVAETMDTLVSLGYDCVLVADCTATKTNRLQRKVEEAYKTVDSEQLINRLLEKGANL